jgi:hypothetical protein
MEGRRLNDSHMAGRHPGGGKRLGKIPPEPGGVGADLAGFRLLYSFKINPSMVLNHEGYFRLRAPSG